MSPAFHPFSRSGSTLPPPNFRPPTVIRNVRLEFNAVRERTRGNVTQRRGDRYEKRVQDFLSNRGWFIEPKIVWFDGTAVRIAWPDAMYVAATHTTVAEVKVRHVVNAYSQLTQLYIPLVNAYQGFSAVGGVVITLEFDPAEFATRRWKRVEEPELHVRLPKVGLFPWGGRW